MTKIKIVDAIPGTNPRYSHMEAEEMMEILLASGHHRAEYLAAKLVTASGNPILYAKTLARVRTNIILTAENHIDGDPIPVQLLQKLVEAQFPEAADFKLAGHQGRRWYEGLTFRAGERFRFAAPNGYVSKDEFDLRTLAADGFRTHMETCENL